MKNIICQVSLLYLLLQICSAKEIPVFFIFGDSLADVGNNLYLNTSARPYYPNGIDFGNPFGIPSGRYTNGRITIDFVEQEAGLKNLTPPCLAPSTTGDVLLKGVNYASSAAGIFNLTGTNFGDRLTLHDQISYFVKTKQDIIAQIGAPAAKKLINRAIYFVEIGSNDVANLVVEIQQHKKKTSSDHLLYNLISTFRPQLIKLYNLGARKIVVSNGESDGCMPFVRDGNPLTVDGCVPDFNKLLKAYNQRLKNLLEELTTNLTGSNYVYADIYAMTQDIIQNYISYGFEIVDEACCHLLGLHGGLIPCTTGSLVCKDRTKYVFWDAFHLTESANQIVAKHMMDGGLNYMSPMNFRQLLNS